MSLEKIKCRFGHESSQRELAENGCYQCEIEEIEKKAQKYFCPYCGKQSEKQFEDGDENYIEISCKDCKSQSFRIYDKEDYSYNPNDDKEPRETYDPGYASEQYRKMIEGEM